jgi:pyruvate,water dikinase
MWAVSLEYPEMAGAGAHPREDLNGTGAWPGLYTGTARVVMTEKDFAKVRPGDVLIAPVTTPAWSIVFPRIGALVTDEGGVLSHTAIVAREFAIPTVVNTGTATRLLRDGIRVTVNGTRGTVELADAPPRPV